MKAKEPIPYGLQEIDKQDIKAVSKVLQSDFLTTGPFVKKFERAFCKFTKATFTTACANGTSALHLACLAVGLKKGDWVIVPSITFLATANAIRFCGAEVLFCDVDEHSGLITQKELKKAISEAKKARLNIKAVISVHLTGKPVDLAGLKEICDQEKLVLISDSCHALGGIYKNHPIGSCLYEDLNTFSFHPVKTITSGEGGAITTNNEEYAHKMVSMRSHGIKRRNAHDKWWEYTIDSLGYNYRMSDIQCALAKSQLSKVEKFIAKRESLVQLYNSKLSKLKPILTIPSSPDKTLVDRVGWHLYSVSIDFEKLMMTRESFMRKLLKKKIRTQVHYIPVHSQPYYKKRYGLKQLKGSNNYFNKTLSLPLFTKMRSTDVNYVAEQIKDIIT